MLVRSLKYIEGRIEKFLFTLFILFFDFRTSGVVFRPPLNEKELEEMFRLRYRVYCKEFNYLPSDNYADGLEKDDYDQHSEYILAVSRNDKIIGCVRLIKPNHKPFPTENSFNISIKDQKNTVEISRLIVEKKFRSTKVGIGLYRGIYRNCARNGYANILEAMEKEVARWINYLFLRFIPITEPKIYYGTMNRAYIANVFDISRAVKKDNYFLFLYLNWKLLDNH